MGFRVSVSGGRAPEFSHPSIEQAMTEAIRLAGTDIAKDRKISILEEVMVLPANFHTHMDFQQVQIIGKHPISVGYIMDLQALSQRIAHAKSRSNVTSIYKFVLYKIKD